MNTATIAPIETVYKGYRMRSRLEVRWAIFLDGCGMRWVYEPEGYLLRSGCYQPDFHLLHAGVFLEVKPMNLFERRDLPEWGTLEPEDYGLPDFYRRAIELSYAVQPVMVVFGDPYEALHTGTMQWFGPSGESRSIINRWADHKDTARMARQVRFGHGEGPPPPPVLRTINQPPTITSSST